jgi:hypothetical protein
MTVLPDERELVAGQRGDPGACANLGKWRCASPMWWPTRRRPAEPAGGCGTSRSWSPTSRPSGLSRWSSPYPHATEAFVAECRLGDGTPAVLKLLIPRDGAAARHELTMLRLAGGRGCADLLCHDASRGALSTR